MTDEAALDALKAVTDSDGDGFTDRQEEDWGTNPRDAGSQPRLDVGMVGLWRLDQFESTTVSDGSPNDLDGQLIGSPLPTLSGSGPDKALTFDGVQNEVQIPDTPALTPRHVVTVAAWVKASREAEGVLVGKWPAKGMQGSYTLSLLEGYLVMELSVGGVYRPLISSTAIEDEGWHYVAAVYDGFEARLYLDGVRVSTTHTGGKLDVVGEPLVMGHFQGSLRNVRLFSKPLQDRELALIYEVELKQLGITQPPPNLMTLRTKAPSLVVGKRPPALDEWGSKSNEKRQLALTEKSRGAR